MEAGGAAGAARPLAFSSRLFPAHRGWAVFPRLSLANHECEPNCQVAYTETNHALLVCVRALAADEEVSISYVSTSLPYAARQAKLLARYGFRCVCARCEAEAAAEEEEEEEEATEAPGEEPAAKRRRRP